MEGNCVGGNRKRCNLRDNETTRNAVPWRMGKIRGKGCGEGRAGDDN